MVNKRLITRKYNYAFLLFFSLFILFFPVGSLSAQKISKAFTSSLQGNGTLYYIYKKPFFKSKKNHSSLTFEITRLSNSDSVSITFSYFEKNLRFIDSVSFLLPTQEITAKTKKIFIDTKGRNWVHRYSAVVLASNFSQFIRQTKPPVIKIYTKEESVSLSIQPDKWKKYSVVVSKINVLIENNRTN